MHGRNVFLMGNLRSLAVPMTGGGPVTGRISGARNLFAPTSAQLFAAGGLLACAKAGDDKPLRKLMSKLAARVAHREEWSDTLRSADPKLRTFENPNIPAGYTYLLQLLAHDLIDSEVSLAEAGVGRPGFANTRVEPLCLDTIYGGGPDNTPFAYEFDRGVRHGDGVPRTRLRLGRLAKADGTTAGCPYRDLARAVPIDVDDSGLYPLEQLDSAALIVPKPGEPQPEQRRPWRTEALVADVRNDSHSLISQLTVLFHILHNHVLGLLGPATLDPVLAYRRYLCARLAVTMIYRSILKRDVMKRILDPVVYARYMRSGTPLLESAPRYGGDLSDLPLEFSHGAFRFGHAMTRDEYRINSDEPQEFVRALDQGSVHGPSTLPVRELWHVDWSLFFETGSAPPNWSVRIGPNSAGPLLNTKFFPPVVPGLDKEGVPNRDLLSACFADIWSVSHLSAELRGMPGIAAIVPDFGVWKQPLREWLGRFAGDFTPEEIEILANDPPMPFFVMFEAAHVLDKGVPNATGGGQRLGPVGSIIAAETIFGALQRNPIGYEAAGASLPDHLAAVCAALNDDASALSAIPDIPDMPALLRFLKSGGVIALPGPA